MVPLIALVNVGLNLHHPVTLKVIAFSERGLMKQRFGLAIGKTLIYRQGSVRRLKFRHSNESTNLVIIISMVAFSQTEPLTGYLLGCGSLVVAVVSTDLY